jgi:dienelactone hydrolase
VWGRADHAVGIPNVAKFAAELEDRKIEADITFYPDVGHGFMAALGSDDGSPATSTPRTHGSGCCRFTTATSFRLDNPRDPISNSAGKDSFP